MHQPVVATQALNVSTWLMSTDSLIPLGRTSASWRDRREPDSWGGRSVYIAEIKAGLAHGRSEAEQALARLNGVNDEVDKAIAILQALAAGTQQPAVMGAISKLGAAKQQFGEGAKLIRAAIDQTEKYSAIL
jgi:hypothetical protein